MFHQLLTPVGNSLLLSFAVAAIPVVSILLLLGVFRRPAWQASIIGLTIGWIIAVTFWQFPAGMALKAVFAGAVFALWPVMWIVVTGLFLFNISVRSGSFAAFRNWILDHIPNDRRIVLIVVGFCFGALLEGVAGFGTPVAITSALLVALGFPAIEALTYTLIFNTAPVAFGALGIPITVLGTVTGLPDTTLGAMVGRQLPIFALLLPLYAVVLHSGWRSVSKVWPMLLVSGGTFAITQFIVSNFINYALTDVLSSLISLGASIAFLKVWKFPVDPAYAIGSSTREKLPRNAILGGWLPWLTLSVVVIAWTLGAVATKGAMSIPWQGLHNQVFITLYDKPYAAVWSFQPLATGTAIAVASVITALCSGTSIPDVRYAITETWKQVRLVIVTVASIIGLAYLMNYSGLTYTLGLGIASVGAAFPLVSAFLGWGAVFLSGSDTSGNALFGNLQVAAAHQLNLDPVLMAASNSSGGVMGKMISPQNISTGASTTNLKGREGEIFARTFKHSIAMTIFLGLIVYLQQTYFSFMIPPH